MELKEQEFTRLVERHKTVVYTVCYMFSGGREEAEDLFQDVLVRLWRGYDSFRGESDVRTWIYRVSLNTCINGQKRKKRRQKTTRVPLSVDVDLFGGISDRALQVRRLYDRINRLGLVDRALILLWLEGLSYEEIGAVIGISVKNVSFQLYRIKEELKKMNI
ncbi:sigma-70 family RNA polymerase sigma factor [uncultured Alistipes sp.]|uniref:RNA polymerase sigma factor n=1 Tax=uncultured Alistipes sp. TaxID=538949 RepID=UPI00262480EC|nr:sigma-70 family RNA polymerase sigma factor [uncultured Alistipes sp.]